MKINKLRRIKSREELIKMAGGSAIVEWLRRNNLTLLDTILPKIVKHWTIEELKQEALKYKTRIDWQMNGRGYQSAHQNKWLDECCKHMIMKRKPKGWYNLASLKKGAKKYKSRSGLKRKNINMYTVARKRGLLDDLYPRDPKYINLGLVVINLDTKKKYQSISKAASAINRNVSTLSRAIKLNRKCGGHRFKLYDGKGK